MDTAHDLVDPEAAGDLRPHLAAGETLAWAARPAAAVYCRLRPRLVALGVFWVAVSGAGFYGFAATLLDDEYGGVALGARIAVLALAAAPFALVAVVCLGGHVRVLRRARSRIAYGLTGRRVLVLAPELGVVGKPRLRSVDLADGTLRTPDDADGAPGTVEVHDRRGVGDALTLEGVAPGALELLGRRIGRQG